MDEFLWPTKAISRVFNADHRLSAAATSTAEALNVQEATAVLAARELTRREREMAALAAADAHVQDLVRVQLSPIIANAVRGARDFYVTSRAP